MFFVVVVFKLFQRLTFFLKNQNKTKPGLVSYSQGCTGEESPGANQGQNDAVSLHQQSRGMCCLRGTDRGWSLIVSELAPLKLYNYQQAGDNSQRPISDQASLFIQGC